MQALVSSILTRSLCLVALLTSPVLFAGEQKQSSCNHTASANVTVLELTPLGSSGERASLTGHEVVLVGGMRLPSGASVGVNDRISSGVLVNTGPVPVQLRLSDGTSAVLHPGDLIGIGEARCRCRCTCTSADGVTQNALFNCSSNSDTCAYDGDECVFVVDGTVHEGTFSGCRKFWVIH